MNNQAIELADEAAPFPVIVFDLDGTLLRGTSVSLCLAAWLGRHSTIADLERRFHANEISNAEIADVSAAWFRGLAPGAVRSALMDADWIDGLVETVSALRARRCRLLLATVTWRFAAEMVAEEHGFEEVCGTEMGMDAGRLTGRVTRYFDEHDKLRFVEEWCERRGYHMAQVAAVGDSRSDVPLFSRVGRAIALNGTATARRAAHYAVDSPDLRAVLPLLSGSSS